jgi:sugar/nucleoside kinase (ribokinase family)
LIDPALPTGTTIVLVDEEGARSMITCLGAAQEFRSDELPAHLRSTSSTLLIEGYMLGVGNGSAPDLFERMADDGATIVLSVAAPWIAERYPEAFQRIFERSRLVFMNEQEGERISGERDPGVAADRLRGTNRTVIVTAGSRGAYLGLPEGLLHSAARSVDVLDTTGAGDSYLAAFLRGVQLGATADQAARGAAFVASEVVSVVGSGTGLDLAEEWRALTFE